LTHCDFLSEVVTDLLRTPGAMAVRVLWTCYNRKRGRMERRSAILSHGDGIAPFEASDQDIDEVVVYLVGQVAHTGRAPAAHSDTLQLLIRGRGGASFPAPARLEDAEYSRRNLSYTVCIDVSDQFKGAVAAQASAS
jgi:hypothetical protein